MEPRPSLVVEPVTKMEQEASSDSCTLCSQTPGDRGGSNSAVGPVRWTHRTL